MAFVHFAYMLAYVLTDQGHSQKFVLARYEVFVWGTWYRVHAKLVETTGCCFHCRS